MDQTIEIYNPKQLPFGPLSNNYENMMIIAGKRYPTVTNFIYSNLLTTPLYRIALQSASVFPEKRNTVIEDKVRQFALSLESKFLQVDIEKIKKYVPLDLDFSKKSIYELYDYYLRAEYIDTARIALEKAYTAKVQEKPSLADKLQSTENRPIIYNSENTVLGVNERGEGLNLLGKILEQIRYNIQREEYVLQRKEKEEKMKDELYNAYKAYLIVQKAILSGGQNLEEYQGLSVDEILEKEEQLAENKEFSNLQKPNKEKAKQLLEKKRDIESKQKEYIFKNYKALYPFLDQAIEKPGYLYKYMMLKNRVFLEEERTKLRKEGIVRGYLMGLISLKFPNMPEKEIEIASTQLFDSYVLNKRKENQPEQGELFQDYKDVEDKIIEKYNKKEFPKEINKAIKRYLKKLNLYKIEQTDFNIEDAEVEEEDPSGESVSSRSSSTSADSVELALGIGEKYLRKRMVKFLKSQGKYKKEYKNYPLDKLRKKVEKLERKIQAQNEDEDTEKMNWAVYGIKPGGRKLLGQYSKKPDRDEMAELHNWNPARIKIVPITDKTEEKEDLKMENQLEVVEENTQKPIYLNLKVKNILTPFSPVFKSSFTVDGLEYPSVSIYLMCCLVSKTGISIKGELPFRGRNIKEAISLLNDGKGKFVSPDDAAKRYLFYYKETISQMSVLLAAIALKKKFDDYYLQTLLLLTGERTIYWADRNDLVLGGTQKGGENEVGKILMDIREKIKGFYIPKNISANDVFNFVKEDAFISSWLNMKIMDMCSTVKKIHTYLTLKGEHLELDAGFVSKVLDEIYQPCSAVKTIAFKVEDEPTFKFVKMVEKCHGGSVSQDYGKKLDEKLNQIREKQAFFWGLQNRRQLREPTPQQKTFEDYLRESEINLQKFLATNPKRKATKKYRLEKTEELATYFDVPEPEGKSKLNEFDQKQYDDWIAFKDALFVGVDVDKFEEIRKIQDKKERKKALKELITRRLSSEEMLTKITEFVEKQSAEYMKYSGRELIQEPSPPKNPEDMERYRLQKELVDQERIKRKAELKQHEEIIKNLVKEQAALQTQRDKEIAYELDKNMSIARVYWKRLIVMLFFLLTKAKQNNDLDLKKLLINIIEVASQPASCKPANFADSQTNCIAQAIINICIGLQSFTDEKEIGNIELELSQAIILGRDFKKKVKVTEVKEKTERTERKKKTERTEKKEGEEKEESEEEETEESEEESEEDSEQEDSSEFVQEEDLDEEKESEKKQQEQDEIDDMSVKEQDFDELDFPDQISEEENFEDGGGDRESGDFGFKSPEKTALNLLQEVWKDADIEIARKFMAMIQKIKNAKVQPKVKMNRILFFASMR